MEHASNARFFLRQAKADILRASPGQTRERAKALGTKNRSAQNPPGQISFILQPVDVVKLLTLEDWPLEGGAAIGRIPLSPSERATPRFRETTFLRPTCFSPVTMFVVKRNGKQERVHFDKITSRITKLAYGLNMNFVDPGELAQVGESASLPKPLAAPTTSKHHLLLYGILCRP
jgi:hypothetical protein